MGRHPSAQVLNVQEQLYLIDCGEGTQMRMDDFNIRKNKIEQIFITHLHGDHVYGLIGLLSSYGLMGRDKPIDVFAPYGLEDIILTNLKYTTSTLPYPLTVHVLDTEQHTLIYENKTLEVFSIPLRHRVPTCGFLFREKPRLRNIIPEKITEYQIPFKQIPRIKEGADFVTAEGAVIPNAALTVPPVPPRSFAYCSDTLYYEAIIPYIKGVDLLYHETTYCHDKLEEAQVAMHTTAFQAATLAKLAGVGRLITGHYSARYADISPIIEEAQAVFANTIAGEEGRSYEVLYERLLPATGF